MKRQIKPVTKIEITVNQISDRTQLSEGDIIQHPYYPNSFWKVQNANLLRQVFPKSDGDYVDSIAVQSVLSIPANTPITKLN